jgi:S-adenosylmethionine:tRNA ribosyltransferase-isomerase
VSSALKPAAWPRAREAARLLHVDPAARTYEDAWVRELPSRLRRADLVVVNDAGTLPASLPGTSRRGPVEVRLAGVPLDADGPWPAVLFGAGSWRQRTEDRGAPPSLRPGERVVFGKGALAAEVASVSAASPRLVELRFDLRGAALWSSLEAIGRPVQYSYVAGPLSPWHVQTAYAARPWAVEMASAGWPLGLPLLAALRARGIDVASLTHAAGLSSTGDAAIDALLPLPEPSDIPAATVAAVERTRASGGRIVAVGTTVVRALEGRAAEGEPLYSGPGLTTLRLGPAHTLRVVDGLLTGLHEPGESHFELLQAFAPRPLLEEALAHAAREGYLGHEFGDLSLVLPGQADEGLIQITRRL